MAKLPKGKTDKPSRREPVERKETAMGAKRAAMRKDAAKEPAGPKPEYDIHGHRILSPQEREKMLRGRYPGIRSDESRLTREEKQEPWVSVENDAIWTGMGND